MKRDNLKILILIGIPASGKSTWAKDYVRRNPDWIRVNRDDFRLMLKDEQLCENKIEDMITGLVKHTIEKSLSKRLNVLVDNTNLKQRYIGEIVDAFKYQADIDYRVFDISLDEAIERDNARSTKVGEVVIKRMHQSYKSLLDTFDFQPVKKIARSIPSYSSDPNLPNAAIFDIDGTLAHMQNRGPFDWDKVDRDAINKIVAEQVDFHRSLGRKILVVSGRDSSCKDLTKEWLDFYGIKFDEIFMRPENDYRKDTIVKREIYKNDIEGKYNVFCVYDDRLQVLDMWYSEGVFTFNVNQGNIDF